MSIINREKIVFVTIDWMKYYEGIREGDVPVGTAGGNPIKHEQYTFFNEDGNCYGYIPPSGGHLNIERICAQEEIKEDIDGYEYIENVLVVFTGKKGDGKNRRVVGFYCDATVYYEPCIKKKRKIKSNNTDVEESSVNYSVFANAQNVYLIPEAERTFELPNSKRDGYGYGQSHKWYADDKDDKRVVAFRNKTVKYIESIINNKRNKPVSEYTVDDQRREHGAHGFGSGESEDHKQFKVFIAKHPELLKIKDFGKGEFEHSFPTQDAIDVYFSNANTIIGVEVKSKISSVDDIKRGLFQCKKYEALIDAENRVNREKKDIKVILALESEFPKELLSIKNILSVNVIDNIRS